MSLDVPGTLLQVRQLEVSFGSADQMVSAVRRIDIAVGAGQAVGLVGESGSGKSATALAIIGLLHPLARASGEIRLGGIDLLQASERELQRIRGRQISMVPQDPLTALNPGITIERQLVAAIRSNKRVSRKDARTRAADHLALVRLRNPTEVLGKYPHELSGGQRQRVVIALALSGDPELLIADEATTALDLTTQLQILSLLKERNETTGLSILVISHDLGVIAALCSYVHVMQEGRIVEHGPTGTVLSDPRHGYTRELLDSLPDPERRDEPLGRAPQDEPDGVEERRSGPRASGAA